MLFTNAVKHINHTYKKTNTCIQKFQILVKVILYSYLHVKENE